MMLKTMPESDRPRERLLREGGRALSDGELVAVLLRTGRPGRSALDMARELLSERGGLAGLATADGSSLRRRGLGEAKMAAVLAACEIARRLAKARLANRDVFVNPASTAAYLVLRYASADQEVFGALYLDVRNRLIAEGEVFRGTLGKTLVEPRAILKEGLLRSASGVVVFHNHPSGDPTPSTEDLEFTRRMAAAGEVVGIRLVDHLILGAAGRWTSLQRRGAW